METSRNQSLGLILGPFFFFARRQSTLPLFEGQEHGIAFAQRTPDGFPLFEPNLVLPLALTFFVTTKVGSLGNPHHAVERYVLIVYDAKNRVLDGHTSTQKILSG